MSRVGLANFKLQAAVPAQHDQVWRENLNREQWDHLYHSRRVEDPKRKYTYKSAQTEGKDKFGKTWHIMSHVHSSAAGQGSYHYNVHKPTGNVQCYHPSSSFTYVPHVSDATNNDNQKLLKQTALFANAPQPQGLADYLLSRKHREAQLYRNGGQVSRRRATSLENLGYDKSTYNEAYYKEGLFNSDTHNQHDARTQSARFQVPGSLLLNHSTPFDGRLQPGPDHGRPQTTYNVNSHQSGPEYSQLYYPENEPASGTSSRGRGGAQQSPAAGRSSSNNKGGALAGTRSGKGPSKLRMASTHTGGFFRDVHGAGNPNRPDVYDQTIGRFDAIRDDKVRNLSESARKKHAFLDSQGDPSVTNPKVRYAQTVSGPFFQAGLEQEVASINRTAEGPLGTLNQREEFHPPRYKIGPREMNAARPRRTNQPQVTSFQRIYQL
ncbi:unnamed protein product [Amoebophrya sp. A25]|nr:unnamed protein product [Amoebophrya sp. A25]|eukprot:GSA25T00010923001.1